MLSHLRTTKLRDWLHFSVDALALASLVSFFTKFYIVNFSSLIQPHSWHWIFFICEKWEASAHYVNISCWRCTVDAWLLTGSSEQLLVLAVVEPVAAGCQLAWLWHPRYHHHCCSGWMGTQIIWNSIIWCFFPSLSRLAAWARLCLQPMWNSGQCSFYCNLVNFWNVLFASAQPLN